MELEFIRITAPDALYRYTNGDCYKLYLHLKHKFPDAKPWYDEIEHHILTELVGGLWDIKGFAYHIHEVPSHIVRWEDTQQSVRDAAPTWSWKPPA